MKTARETAIEAFYADSHPLIDRYIAALGIDEANEGFGVDLSELIAFAEAENE